MLYNTSVNQINPFGNATPSADGTGATNWLRDPSNSLQSVIGDLTSQYGQAGAAYNPAKEIAALKGVDAAHNAMALQEANSAARAYSDTALQQGGSTIGAGVVRGQLLSQADANSFNIKQQEAQLQDQAMQQTFQAKTSIASMMDTLRSKYADMLANFNVNLNATNQATQEHAREFNVGTFNQTAQQNKSQQNVENFWNNTHNTLWGNNTSRTASTPQTNWGIF